LNTLSQNDYLETPFDLFHWIARFWAEAISYPELDLFASKDKGDGKTNSKCFEYIDEEADAFTIPWILDGGRKPLMMWANAPQSINKSIVIEIAKRFRQEPFNLLSIFQGRALKTNYWGKHVIPEWLQVNPFGHVIFYPIPKNIYFEKMSKFVIGKNHQKEHSHDVWFVVIWFESKWRNRIKQRLLDLPMHLNLIPKPLHHDI